MLKKYECNDFIWWRYEMQNIMWILFDCCDAERQVLITCYETNVIYIVLQKLLLECFTIQYAGSSYIPEKRIALSELCWFVSIVP